MPGQKKLDLLAIPKVHAGVNKMLKLMLKETLSSLKENGYRFEKPLTTKAIGEILFSFINETNEDFQSGKTDIAMSLLNDDSLMDYLETNEFIVNIDEENDWNDEGLSGRG